MFRVFRVFRGFDGQLSIIIRDQRKGDHARAQTDEDAEQQIIDDARDIFGHQSEDESDESRRQSADGSGHGLIELRLDGFGGLLLILMLIGILIPVGYLIPVGGGILSHRREGGVLSALLVKRSGHSRFSLHLLTPYW